MARHELLEGFQRNIGGMGILALAISISSIIISFNGNRTQERILAATVWPSLTFGTGNQEGHEKIIGLKLENSGNGPARIRTFTVEYAGKLMPNGGALLSACCGERPKTISSSAVVHRVLRPGEDIVILQVPLEGNDEAVWKRLNDERFKVVFNTCYCSNLDDCWVARSDNFDPAAVSACPPIDDAVQWHG